MTEPNSTPETAAPEKTVIRPKLENYVRAKSAGGKRTHRTDDFVARTLAGKDLGEIKTGAALLGIDATKWNHVNVGQQRMLIGNALRNRLKAEKDGLSEEQVTQVFGEPVAPYDAEAEAAAKAERERVAAEKKAEKEARARDAQAKKEAQASGGSPDPAPDASEKTHSASGKSKAGKSKK